MRKNTDAMYRLGLYGSGIERIKLKKAIQTIARMPGSQARIVDIGHEGFEAACEALELGSVDMAVVSMTELIRMEKNDDDLPDGVVISGVLKREDPRLVMVRKRRTKDIVEDAVVVTDSEMCIEKIVHMYDGISCIVEPDIRKCFEKLDSEECDAVFTTLEDIKASKLHNRLLYRYTIMDYGECVPVHGQGIYAMLTKERKEAVRTARDISHKSTAVCFEIEDDIINKVMQNVYVKTCDVYAKINGDRLEVYADVTGNRGRVCVNEKGELASKNVLTRKIVDRISKNM